jgi:TatD DNase family protein
VLAAARAAGVGMLVLPAVQVADFEALRALAHRHGWPTRWASTRCSPIAPPPTTSTAWPRRSTAGATTRTWSRWARSASTTSCPGSTSTASASFYRAQLALARDAGLPVILHVRRSADALLAGLARTPVVGGIAHAFNGSPAQAARLLDRGLRLGFGGTLSFERALRIRALARTLPDDALVLETDAPDIPPQWLYRTAEQRRDAPQARNVPAELPRIGAVLAALRGWTVEQTAARTAANAVAALPRLQGLLA